MSIRIVSEGAPLKTKILTEDGAELRGVTSINLEISNASPVVTATIEIAAFLDASTEAKFIIADPRHGFMRPVSRIVFADGGDDWVAG